jgi:RHS repeat-associated protein
VAYTWNANGHLASQAWHGLTVDYAPLGQPTKAGTWDYTTGEAYSHYTLDGRLVMSSNKRTGKVRDYVQLNGSLLGILERDEATGVYTTLFHHNDALGSPVAVTDLNRAVVEKTEYAPYGKALNRAMRDGPGYTGHVEDKETGRSYMQQRYYDPMIGRFLSVDPVTADSSTGANFSRYWYANDNPFRFLDPDGRISKELKRQGYEEIGDGYVVRVDSIRGRGGESEFEVHVYKDSSAFQKAYADDIPILEESWKSDAVGRRSVLRVSRSSAAQST